MGGCEEIKRASATNCLFEKKEWLFEFFYRSHHRLGTWKMVEEEEYYVLTIASPASCFTATIRFSSSRS
jgi:hypothetical protein